MPAHHAEVPMKHSTWYLSVFLALVPTFSPAADVTVQDNHATLMERGWQAFRQGAFEEAGQSWTEAAREYAARNDTARQTEAVTYLAFAYESLGQYRKAVQQLELAQALTLQTESPSRQAVLLGHLANDYLSLGQLEAAEKFFTEATEQARALQDKALLAPLLNDCGNLFVAKGQNSDAARVYTESANLAKELNEPALAATALVNLVRATADPGQPSTKRALLDEALSYATRMAPSHEKAYALITIGLAYDELGRFKPAEDLRSLAASAFADAAALAESLTDARAESYAWGFWGSLVEREGRDQEALDLTRKAVVAAQRVHAPESLYRWYWQTGRLLNRTGDLDGAIAAYRRAVTLLQAIRPEMAAGYSTGRTSFRESVGPVYFELADILLRRSGSDGDVRNTEALLSEARDTVELLKAAELRDYFRDDCVDAAQAQLTKLDVVSPTAIAIYPILLPDRMELLVSLPDGMKRVMVPVSADKITQEIRTFRALLEKRTTREYLPHAQTLYDWIMRPLEPLLATSKIDTLVFVPDGPLRTIPMAALHDGHEFLIGKYAVATSPGLNLTDPRPLRRQAIKMLGAGLTESVQGFPPLPNVSAELEAIQKLYHGESMVNKDFQMARFAKVLADKGLTLVHIASHGEFKYAAADSFLLTYDGKLTMDRLNEYIGLFRFREEPLELLTLSACETAAGDDRAALGLAGVAIKAGARSALATLWAINDEASSDLVADFYQELQEPAISKALALQRAQLKLMSDPRYQHPGYWSPFLLLNNWL
jgi:CHAT domain-containing protein